MQCYNKIKSIKTLLSRTRIKIQTIGDEFEEIFVKPTISEKKIVTLSKLSAMTCLNGKKWIRLEKKNLKVVDVK
jgi:hypothetical protein